MAAERLERLRKRLARKRRDIEASRTASRNRVARGDPETKREKAQVAAREAKGAAKEAKKFLKTASEPVRSTSEEQDMASMEEPQAQEQMSQAAVESPQNAIVAPKDTTIVTPASALYAQQLAPRFDSVGTADTDGVVEPKDLRPGIDIDGDGEPDAGEVFRPVSGPGSVDDVPVGDRQSQPQLDAGPQKDQPASAADPVLDLEGGDAGKSIEEDFLGDT